MNKKKDWIVDLLCSGIIAALVTAVLSFVLLFLYVILTDGAY